MYKEWDFHRIQVATMCGSRGRIYNITVSPIREDTTPPYKLKIISSKKVGGQYSSNYETIVHFDEDYDTYAEAKLSADEYEDNLYEFVKKYGLDKS